MLLLPLPLLRLELRRPLLCLKQVMRVKYLLLTRPKKPAAMTLAGGKAAVRRRRKNRLPMTMPGVGLPLKPKQRIMNGKLPRSKPLESATAVVLIPVIFVLPVLLEPCVRGHNSVELTAIIIFIIILMSQTQTGRHMVLQLLLRLLPTPTLLEIDCCTTIAAGEHPRPPKAARYEITGAPCLSSEGGGGGGGHG